ncbi:Serine palmitoyltransferase 1 [Balamuthia mandrillaris]
MSATLPWLAAYLPAELHPFHICLEAFFVIFIVYLLLQKSYKIKEKPERLTDQEIDELVAEWEPLPLSPALSEFQKWSATTVPTITSDNGKLIEVNGKEAINMATTNFLGMSSNPELKKTAENALRTYGCGSCGPRGFYGTMDVHLELEKKIAEFMGTEEAIIYSSGFATIASAIPAFSKVSDLIICDEGVAHALQTGIVRSRSKVVYFRHNDMSDLRRILQSIQQEDARMRRNPKLYRKFVVVEGLYANHGDIAPLKQLLLLKREFCFRLIMDDSFGIGTLGASGRGTCEHWGVDAREIDILTASMGHALGSLGGFCCSSNAVVFHQRLMGSGYVFSASSPPYIVAAALKAFELIDEHTGFLQQKLQDKVALFHKEMSDIERYGVTMQGTDPLSPIIHLRRLQNRSANNREDEQQEGSSKQLTTAERKKAKRYEDEKYLQGVVDEALHRGLLLTRAHYTEVERFLPEPSIRVVISSVLEDEQIVKAAEIIKEALVHYDVFCSEQKQKSQNSHRNK